MKKREREEGAVVCKCKNSRCLKMYCECFRANGKKKKKKDTPLLFPSLSLPLPLSIFSYPLIS